VDSGASCGSVVMICPNLKCRRVLQVPSKYRGQHVKCRYCSLTFAVPLLKLEARSAGTIVDEAKGKKEQGSKKEESGKKK